MMHLILYNKDGFTSDTEVMCHRGKTASLAGKAGSPRAAEVPARALTSRRCKPVLRGTTRRPSCPTQQHPQLHPQRAVGQAPVAGVGKGARTLAGASAKRFEIKSFCTCCLGGAGPSGSR